jgi:hypothetical protein
MTDLFTEESERKGLPGNLNVLTILTFIGCGIGFFGGILQYINADKSVANMEKTMSSPDFNSMPEFVKKMMTPEALEKARVLAVNKLPLLILGLVGVALCLAGALQMRKLRMQGYYLWLLGEIVPVIGMIIFIGDGAYTGWAAMITYVILLLFVILYTLERKYLVNQ